MFDFQGYRTARTCCAGFLVGTPLNSYMQFGIIPITSSSSSGPTSECVTVEELKRHLRINIDDEDDDLTNDLTAAVEEFQRQTGRQLSVAQYTLLFDQWPSVIPLPPLISIDEIRYIDGNGDQQTYDDYLLDDTREPARIAPLHSWPSVFHQLAPIEIDITCGYTQVPEILRRAIKLWAGDMYVFRTANLATLGTVRPIPMGLNSILASWRVWLP